MNDAEIFESLKKKIENIKGDPKGKLLNSLMVSLTLDSKRFRKRAQEIDLIIQRLTND